MQGRVAVLTLMLSLSAWGGTSAARCSDPQEDVAVALSEEPRGWLGVSITDLTAEQAKKIKSGATAGALVTDVQKESPAAKAGLKDNDIIIQFGERTVEDVDDLQKAVRKSKPGSAAKITLMRGEKKMTLTVTVGKAPKGQWPGTWYGNTGPMHSFSRQFHFSTGSSLYGLELWELNQQMGEYFGAPNGRGVLVIGVEKESEGARAGFKAGDVLLRVGRETIEDLRDISEGFEEFKDGDSVPVEILRKGERKTLGITADDGEALLGSSGGIVPIPELHTVPGIHLRLAPRIDRRGLDSILRLQRENLQESKMESMKDLQRELQKVSRQVQKSTRELKQSLWKEMRAADI